MKANTILESLDDISHEMVTQEADSPAPSHLESIPTGSREPRHVTLPVWALEQSESPGYRHWGINE
jgi:hypothetical protein